MKRSDEVPTFAELMHDRRKGETWGQARRRAARHLWDILDRLEEEKAEEEKRLRAESERAPPCT